MSRPLPYDEYKFDRIVSSENIINTPVDSDFGYFVEVDLSYPDDIKEKTMKFPFRPEKKFVSKTAFNGYMKKIKPIPTYHKKIICDWTDKKK